MLISSITSWPASIVICVGLFIAAERQMVVYGSEQFRDCFNDSLNDCLSSSEPGRFTYSLTHETNEIRFSKSQRYNFDELSATDYAEFKSKSTDDWRAADQQTSLKQVLFIHRHGDRTPITFAPNDKLASDPFWTFHGLGQLTNRGKARLNMLGKIMRMRYDLFFDGSINKNIRKSRASGALRCIESAQVFLASFLGLDQSNSTDAGDLFWDRDDNKLARIWQPSSVNTLSSQIDGMLNEGAHCANIDKEYDLIDHSPENRQLSLEFDNESSLLKEILNFDTDRFYKWFWASSFLEVERSYFMDKVDQNLNMAFSRIEEAGNRAIVLYQSTLLAKRLRSGLLINDMIDNMQLFRKVAQGRLSASAFTKKFVHYSAHDLNLIVLLGMFENIEKYPFRPDYASNIAVELHEENGEWFVKIFYMSHVPSIPIELHIAMCESLHPKHRCTLDKFDSIMQRYKIDSWQSWMKECNNSISLIDPYAQNS